VARVGLGWDEVSVRQLFIVPGMLAVLVLAPACDSPSAPSDVAVGEEFTLAIGEAARVGQDALNLGFERVAEDSRCPSDASCVWAGQVVVEVSLGGSRRLLKLDEPADSDGYRARLLRVAPYPSSAAPIEASQYRATFVVEQR